MKLGGAARNAISGCGALNSQGISSSNVWMTVKVRKPPGKRLNSILALGF